jgi:hypothetical protein
MEVPTVNESYSPKHRGEPEPPRPETLALIADLAADIALLEAEEAVLRAELGLPQREDLP